MIRIPGGTFRMGSDMHYPEEAPAHRVTIGPFRIDVAPVTNAQFRTFVRETGYVTWAEIDPDPKDYPGAKPDMLKAGGLAFTPPRKLEGLSDWSQWWRFTFGANWRRPYGKGSHIGGLDDHPVVQIAYKDAEAYAKWAGKELPTEAEWEFAARLLRSTRSQTITGAAPAASRVVGRRTALSRQIQDRLLVDDEGNFPIENDRTDGWARTSPVRAFPANRYGVHDMIGNVWEWTADWYSARHVADAAKACCIPDNPRGAPMEGSYDPRQPNIRIPRKVLKGGSHLCAPSYCRRYRPAARHAEPVDTSTSHVGFRCVVRR